MPFLPPEIWGEIFSYACLDNGYTGRSLTRVSKEFRAASLPHKFQSISIKTAKHIFSFAKLLTETPPHLRRIRHLLLVAPYMRSDNASDDETDSTFESDEDIGTSDAGHIPEGSDTGAVEYAALTQGESQEFQQDLAPFYSEEPIPVRPVEDIEQLARKSRKDVLALEHALFDAVDHIITLCSSTLTSLCLHIRTDNPYGPFLCLPCPLPELQELQWALVTGHTTRVQHQDMPIHSLRTLVCNMLINTLHRARIMELCPEITYLRGRLVVDEFWEMFNREPPSLDNVPPFLTEYRIDVLAVQQDPSTWDKCQFTALVRELEQQLPDKRIKFQTILERDVPSVEMDWLDRLSGGKGICQRMPFPISI